MLIFHLFAAENRTQPKSKAVPKPIPLLIVENTPEGAVKSSHAPKHGYPLGVPQHFSKNIDVRTSKLYHIPFMSDPNLTDWEFFAARSGRTWRSFLLEELDERVSSHGLSRRQADR